MVSSVYVLCLVVMFQFLQVCGLEEYLLGEYPLIQYKVCDPIYPCTHTHITILMFTVKFILMQK